MLESNQRKLYFYEFVDYEGSFWAYSETRYTEAGLAELIRPFVEKFQQGIDEYDRQCRIMFNRFQLGELNKKEYNEEDDRLLDESPYAKPGEGLRDFLKKKGMTILEPDASTSAKMTMW